MNSADPKSVVNISGEPPKTGEAREVAPGVLWLRMPLPFSLKHINLWAARDGDGWAVFDTGVQNSETGAAWRALCGKLGALEERRITRVFATHMHPDHVGMAGWLTRKFGGQLWMSRSDYLTCRVLVADTGREVPADGINFYRAAGWNDDVIEEYRTRFGGFGKLVYALPDTYRRLHDGELLRIGKHEWKVILCSGHSPEHACFYCAELKLFLSGDQVLARISPNVSVFPTEPDADPLGDFLASIDRLLREVPNEVLVLAAHNDPFYGLHARLRHLLRHHQGRLERLRNALSTPKRAMDLFGDLFGRPVGSDFDLLSMATGESIAHLNHLLHRGEITKEIGEDGIAWYSRR